jgi:hypothetical protein
VQEELREGNGDRWERRPVADQPHDHAPTPPPRDNNRHANEGENIDAIANADTCRSLGGHRRTLPLQPCCCAAARRQQPPKSDEYASN